MELIYSMRRKPLKCEPPHFESVSDPAVIRPICTISICNIIAFSSPTELQDVDGETWGGHVYVCDLDTPWNSHKVTSTRFPVSVLEWDSLGKQLAIGTREGELFVYGQKDHLLNQWTCLYTAKFPGEHMLRAVFFHSGRRVVTVDKKPDAPITERIQVLRSTPTLKGFGGVWCEGLCAVTATGLLCGVTPPAAPAGGTHTPEAQTVTESLRAHRQYLTNAAFAHKNGGLLVAAVEGGAGGRVRCFLASCARCGAVPGRAALAALLVQPLPALQPPCPAPVTVSWLVNEDSACLAVAGVTLSLWRLTDRALPVHVLFAKGAVQGNTTPGGGQKPGGDCFNTVAWQQTAMWPVEKEVSNSARTGLVRVAGAASQIVLATRNTLHLMSRDTHHYVCRVPVVTSGGIEGPEVEGSPPKRHKPGTGPSGVACAHVSSVCVSWLGGVAVCVDTHAQLHVYRLPQPWNEIPSTLGVSEAVLALEYALVAAGDALDLILATRRQLAEPIVDRLTESFQRQPQSFQQYYYHAWLKLRMALCRTLPSAQASLSWLTCAQSVAAAWAALSGAVRCDVTTEHAPLLALIDETADLDKAVVTVEAKCELLSEPLSPLQGLRCVTSRMWHIAATLLAAAVTSHHQPHQHGYDLLKDPVALSQLRRVLAVTRSVGDPNVSRLVARLGACNTPKPDLLEECVSVTSQVSWPRIWESLPRVALSAPHTRPPPYYFEYGVEPDSVKYTPDAPAAPHCDVAPSNTMDGIRYMHLGGGDRPCRLRSCGRCGTRALPHGAASRHPHMRAYEASFLTHCRCGGKWTLISNV